ncbi:hypothetical protein K432DRAFT_457722 [Lepidopterella palustris CBS 459.81]|uniref:DUF7587 domain-containing protein n=1 Tax=Lepidopterella palustris CBS 459.81 TaxID=1314670 RepID=A0A8E2JDD6_9PEZI|nr:hypothetical protein K432DRAFT_457722 [Lepidopterella palustris CBS 459.81]
MTEPLLHFTQTFSSQHKGFIAIKGPETKCCYRTLRPQQSRRPQQNHIMATHWTFNGSIQNLQIYVYAPKPTNDALTTAALHPETLFRNSLNSLDGDRTAQNTEDRAVSSGIKKEPITSPIILDSQAPRGGGVTLDENDDCYEDVLRGPLPWHRVPNFPLKQEHTPVRHRDDDDQAADHQSYSDNITGCNGEAIPQHLNEYSSTISESVKNSNSTLLPSLRRLGISYNDLESATDSSTAYSRESGSPCPRRTTEVLKWPTKRTRRTSRYFDTARNAKESHYTSQKKKAILEKITKRSKPPCLSTPTSTESLRRIERTPSHKWTHRERVLLCVSKRWYNHAQGWDSITRIFNHLTGNLLRTRVVCIQWEDMRFYGLDRAWCEVYKSTSFEDEQGQFRHIREDLEKSASALNIAIERKTIEERLIVGNAVFSSSPLVLQRVKVLSARPPVAIGSSSLDLDTLHGFSDQPTPVQTPITRTISPNEIGGFDVADAVEPLDTMDFEEIDLADTIDTPGILEDFDGGKFTRPRSAYYVANLYTELTSTAQSFSRQAPTLVYRVYDERSQTQRTSHGFRAAFFGSRKRGVTNALSIDDELFEAFAEKHFWEHVKGCSPFISVTDSLLCAIVYARRSFHDGRKTRVAVMDISNLGSSTFNAADLIARLKRKGELEGCRYKGGGEWVVWGEIPSSAIMYDFAFSELQDLASRDAAVEQTLRLQEIFANTKVYWLHQKFAQAAIPLRSDAANAIGRVADVFGLGYASNVQIEEFVRGFVQGWAIDAPIHQTITMTNRATEFVSALSYYVTHRRCVSEADEEGLRRAFVDGVARASAELKRTRRRVKKNRPGRRSHQS